MFVLKLSGIQSYLLKKYPVYRANILHLIKKDKKKKFFSVHNFFLTTFSANNAFFIFVCMRANKTLFDKNYVNIFKSITYILDVL